MASTLTTLLQTLRIVPMTHSKLPTHAAEVGIMPDKAKVKLTDQQLPELTLEQVAHHDSYDDCWIVIYDRVYDVTQFLHDHPGGEDVIMDHAGRDATIAFHGTGHSRAAIEKMREFLIGELPTEQRIFRTGQNRVLSSGIPE
ncbi:cytochrome b5 [Scaptodrosophila lebanonensis]|uniref:Cytochrome b5 n=1 Tax=Drosophila lebanonensis TaxID=7225 RepID=A0A6J2U6L3_DROLE|nr:cytochrome b5 [Scaptodrosophila lebanonensis]